MSKHSTTHRTLSRRLAALLAALALLAAMALPVYAEALDGATGTAQAEIGDTISDGTVTTENDSTTPEGKEAAEGSTANADGDNASENKETDADNADGDNASENKKTDADVDDGSSDLEDADISDETKDSTSKDFSDNSESPEDVQQQDDGEAEGTSLATQASVENTFTIYFAVPSSWGDGNYQVYVKAQKGGEGDGANLYAYHEMKKVETSKYQDRILYKVDLTFSKNDTSTDCPWDGYNTLQFCKIENSVETWLIAFSNTWTNKSVFANNLFDGENSNWVQNYQPFDPNNHQMFAGKTMLFQNQSDRELTDVKAIFYENDQEVETIDLGALGTIAVGKRVSFKIPEKNCTYIRFIVGGVETPLYSFYGQQDGGATDKSFIYDSGKAFCYIYQTNDSGSWATPQGKNKIYFDATFSKMETNSPNDAGGDYSIPAAGKTDVYYRAKGAGVNFVSGSMTQDSPNSNLYYVELNAAYTEIAFSQGDLTNDTISANNGQSTAWEIIPQTYENPCFYADTYDDSVYGKGPRSGYWDKKGEIRDAEKGKGKTNDPVVNVPPATFTPESNTKYINTTLYDYYTDWELNGNNRDSYAATFNKQNFACHRNWVTFRQFDQALSDYYNNSGATVPYPMYTGQFQPAAYDKDDGRLWGIGFAEVADSLNLYGYSDEDKNKFMAVNNSTINVDGVGLNKDDTKYYDDAFQGLTGDTLVNGEPVLYNTNLTVPYFNKDFLLKSNSKNAKLGEVYDNVSFPFTKRQGVFHNGNESSVEYWYFDSNDTTLYLKQDTGNNDYFLQKSEDNRNRSRNLKSNSDYHENGTFGFFPFNEHSTDHQASTYNYGFGAKLKFQFTMNEDGQVYGTDGKTKVPIKFFFSGDDDVWVYIDDELALDVGGDHGKVSGLLEFGQNKKGDLVYTPYVSDVKASNAARMYQYDSSGKSVEYLKTGNNIPFHYKGTEKPITPGTHTLTMYYMERGMWESNMAIAFNFPDHNELQVEKEVNLTDVNEIFKSSFQNRELFAFTIQNQATHYGAKEADSTGKVKTETVDLKSAKLTTTTTDTSSGNIFTQAPDPDANTGQTLHWYAPYTDTSSSHRGDRYGILTLGKPIDISNMKYLTFKLYVKSAEGQSTPSITNMYLELLDNQSPPKQKGGVNKASLGGTTYGVVTMAEDKWITVKLDLDKLTAEKEFNDQVQTIRFGCNYPRDIYLKDFTFTSAVPDVVQVGFTTKQDQIPDYGSATSGKLENATNARFTSSNKTKGTQVVDKDGKFLLADGETVTFTDQFRRGSYISLNEELNDKLFDTSWTLYENDVPVTAMETGTKVRNPDSIPSLQNVKTAGPDDGRQEVYDGAINVANAGYQVTGKAKPESANTIVFRSYSNPDAGVDTAFTKLKVKYVNKVKTGSLTIKKEAASSETLSGTYTFTVTFTNVGGLGLESEGIVQPVKIKGTSETTITGIPLGTRFRVEETGQDDGSHLQGVTFTNCDDGAVIDNKQVHGTITAREDGKITTVTFTNTKHELFDLTLTKQWKDADGNDLTTNLPKQIYVQLQRQKAGDTTWTAVQYPKDSNLNYVTIAPDNSGWHYPFVGLDRTDVSDTTNNDKPKWKYRVVEGTLGTDGKFKPLAEGETILLKGNVYTVTGGEETTGVDNNTSATLINILQNPKFTLDVTKKSAENDGEGGQQKLLAGVEFTLEKMKDDGTGKLVVDSSFKRTGVTNAQGELMLTGSNGEATATKGFKDLEAGTYRLTETKAAKDYNLLSEPIIISFSKDGKCKVGDDNPMQANENEIFTGNAAEGYTLKLTVLNRKTPALPHTGADAPSLWLLIGLPLAVAGLLILVFRYNKKGGRTR